jgi:hypothetical protein
MTTTDAEFDRAQSLELQNAIANERPGINNLIERRDMTKEL